MIRDTWTACEAALRGESEQVKVVPWLKEAAFLSQTRRRCPREISKNTSPCIFISLHPETFPVEPPSRYIIKTWLPLTPLSLFLSLLLHPRSPLTWQENQPVQAIYLAIKIKRANFTYVPGMIRRVARDKRNREPSNDCTRSSLTPWSFSKLGQKLDHRVTRMWIQKERLCDESATYLHRRRSRNSIEIR